MNQGNCGNNAELRISHIQAKMNVIKRGSFTSHEFINFAVI